MKLKLTELRKLIKQVIHESINEEPCLRLLDNVFTTRGLTTNDVKHIRWEITRNGVHLEDNGKLGHISGDVSREELSQHNISVDDLVEFISECGGTQLYEGDYEGE